MANKGLGKPASDTWVLVTGGAGFIGSHTCVELMQAGYRAVILDDLSNSSEVAVQRIRAITGADEERLVEIRRRDVVSQVNDRRLAFRRLVHQLRDAVPRLGVFRGDRHRARVHADGRSGLMDITGIVHLPTLERKPRAFGGAVHVLGQADVGTPLHVVGFLLPNALARLER